MFTEPLQMISFITHDVISEDFESSAYPWTCEEISSHLVGG
jgi:hypothetical protein